MSISDVSHTMNRIESATPDSPIAVFFMPSFEDKLNNRLEALFGAAIFTQRRAKADKNFIGYFDKYMDKKTVRNILKDAIKGDFDRNFPETEYG